MITMPKLKNYYKILQIDPSAEQEVVEAAYRRLARKYHPDTNQSSNATQRMQEINEAYEILKDQVKRARYDQEQSFNTPDSDKDSKSDEQRRKEQADSEKRRAQEERAKKEKESSEQYRKEQSEAEQHRDRENERLEREKIAEEQKRNLNNLQKESRNQKQILVIMLGLLLFLSVAIVIGVVSFVFGSSKYFPYQLSNSTQITSVTRIVPVTKIDFSTIEVTQVIPITQIAPTTIEVTQVIFSTQVIQVTQVIPITQVTPVVTTVIPIMQLVLPPVITKTPKSPKSTETPTFSNTPPTFIYPVDGQVLDYKNSYLFKVTPVSGANEYLWGFFQNNVLVWENLRDEGVLSGTEYGIDESSYAHSKFQQGLVEIWVRAKINGEFTDAAIITINLKPQ